MSWLRWFGFRKAQAADADDALLERRVIVLRGMIDDTAANHLIAKLLYLRDQNRIAPIRLHIDSPGGRVSASLAIRDEMQAGGTEVYTHCSARALGTAAVILAHGARGHRTAEPHARLSLCRIEGDSTAPASDLLVTEQILVAMLATDTGQSSATIADDMRASRQFDAGAAAVYGLIDRVAHDA